MKSPGGEAATARSACTPQLDVPRTGLPTNQPIRKQDPGRRQGAEREALEGRDGDGSRDGGVGERRGGQALERRGDRRGVESELVGRAEVARQDRFTDQPEHPPRCRILMFARLQRPQDASRAPGRRHALGFEAHGRQRVPRIDPGSCLGAIASADQEAQRDALVRQLVLAAQLQPARRQELRVARHLQEVLGQVDRNGECGARVRETHPHDPDAASVLVDYRAAATAGIDDRVGLEIASAVFFVGTPRNDGSGRGAEPATRYAAGQAPIGGLFALLHGRGVLKTVRNGLPFSMFDELVGAVGGSQRELAAIIGIPATTLARRKRSGMLRHRVVHVRLMLDHHVQRLHAAVTARRSIDQAMQCMR